jgi:redox-sensitive bicupin YhaK (pirin superfamily)
MSVIDVIDPRPRDLGGFTVRRLLPHATRQMVGPFIFFDHLGHADLAPGQGIDVRPHPHIGLATVTYLFRGALRHRDSLGTVQDIRPGDVNWMIAGHGITHSERTPPAERVAGGPIHGIQSWVALPDGCEDVEPDFKHYPSAGIPQRSAGGIDVKVIAGSAFGLTSPVATQWPTLYIEARLADGARLHVPREHAERAIHVVDGAVEAAGRTLSGGQMGVVETGADVELRAIGAAHCLLLGGERFPSPRLIWWNFVASSRTRIEAAKERWRQQQFAPVPRESEFVPLPNE